MALGKAGKKDTKTGGFKYKPRTQEQMQSRASQQGGAWDSPTIDAAKAYKPKGECEIRIMPPTWDNPEHFGVDFWMHRNIGPDGGTFTCLAKMSGGKNPCPMCEARTEAEKAEEEELVAALRPIRRVATWVIDRKAEKEGPKLWLMPWTVDRDICAIAVDKKTGEIYQLDDPEEGYDVSFRVDGEKLQTKYVGLQVARRASPLSDDGDQSQEWLEFIAKHPVPECFVLREYDYIEGLLQGGVKTADKKDEDEPKVKGKILASKKKQVEEKDEEEDEDEKPKKKSKVKGEEEETESEDLTWEEIHELDEDQLEAMVAEKELDEEAFADCNGLEELQDKLAELLEVEAPEPEEKEEKKGKALSLKERLASMKKGKK